MTREINIKEKEERRKMANTILAIENRKSKIENCSKGFSLVEMLVAITITSVVIVTVAVSLNTPLRSHEAIEEKTEIVNFVSEKMNEVMAKAYDNVLEGTTLSDQVTIDGELINREVIVEIHRGQPDPTADPALKKITVRIGGAQIETLKSNYEHDPNAPPPA
ncbi:MAG: type II secretion system protein J [Nitrospinota bacterium]